MRLIAPGFPESYTFNLDFYSNFSYHFQYVVPDEDQTCPTIISLKVGPVPTSSVKVWLSRKRKHPLPERTTFFEDIPEVAVDALRNSPFWKVDDSFLLMDESYQEVTLSFCNNDDNLGYTIFGSLWASPDSTGSITVVMDSRKGTGTEPHTFTVKTSISTVLIFTGNILQLKSLVVEYGTPGFPLKMTDIYFGQFHHMHYKQSCFQLKGCLTDEMLVLPFQSEIKPFHQSFYTVGQLQCLPFPVIPKPITRSAVPLQNALLPSIKCNGHEFAKVHKEMHNLFKEMESATDAGYLNDLRYQVEMLALTDIFRVCQTWADGMHSIKVVNRTREFFCGVDYPLENILPSGNGAHFNNFTASLNKLQNEPCCYLDANWQYCCQPKTVIYPYEELGIVDDAVITAECRTPECANIIAEEYGDLRNQASNEATGCANILANINDEAIFEETVKDTLRICDKKVYGEDYSGIYCVGDHDCPQDISCGTNHKCALNSTRAEWHWIECFLSITDSFVLHHLKQKFQFDGTVDDFMQLDFFFRDDCRSPVSALPSTERSYIGAHSYWQYKKVDESCEDDCVSDPVCLSPACAADIECLIPGETQSPGCIRNWIFVDSTPDTCQSIGFCNKASGIRDPESCKGPFCGVCDEEENVCSAITGRNFITCDATPVCIQPNGHVSAAQDECGLCLHPWTYEELPLPKEACLASVHCNDEQWFPPEYYASNDDYLQTEGFCYYNLPPYSKLSCFASRSNSTFTTTALQSRELDYVFTNFIKTPLGCVILAEDNTGQNTCGWECCDDIASGGSRSGYELDDVRLGVLRRDVSVMTKRDPAVQSCASFYNQIPQVCEEKSNSFFLFGWPTSLGNELLVQTPKNEDECTCSGGSMKPLFKDKPGLWRNGSLNTPSMTNSKWVSYYWGRSLDYTKIEREVSEATTLFHSLLKQSQLLCRFSRLSSAMQTLSCDCASSEDGCYMKDDLVLPLATRRLCTAVPLSVAVYPFTAFFPENTLDGDKGQCVDFKVLFRTAFQFRALKQKKLSATFSYLEPDDTNEWEVVYNENGSVIGQIVGDGIELQVPLLFHNFELCLAMKGNLYGNAPAKYTLFSIAKVIDNRLVPLQQETFLRDIGQNRHICTLITLDEGSHALLPIVSVPDWQTESGDSLTNSEIERLSSLSRFSLYVSLTIFTYLLGTNGYLSVRGLYFILLAGEIVDDSGVADYILVELPTLVFFIAFALICAIFISIISAAVFGDVEKSCIVFYGWLILCVLALFLFVFIVLLYELLPEEDTEKCGGRDYDEPPEHQPRDYVNIFYKALYMTTAIAVAIGFLLFGGKIYAKVVTLRRKTRRQGQRKGLRVFIVTIIGIYAFLGQSTFLLALAITEWTHVIAGSLILIIIEVIPAASMVFILVPIYHRRIQPKVSTTSSTSSADPSTKSSISTASTSTQPSQRTMSFSSSSSGQM
ncbi:hypothetical protein QOT17_015212 [Balamuthia mandrillaris]